MTKPLILITNDDGVLAPGIKAAAEAVADFADIIIAAPRFEQSGAGHSYPKADTNGIIEEFELEINSKKLIAYGIHGSPAQAVSHGYYCLCERRPDLCISGINYGENIGRNITASGTIGAALAASHYKIPSLAVSQEKYASNVQHKKAVEANFEVSKHFTRLFAEKVLKEGLPEGVEILSINVPSTATPNTEIRYTVQSKDPHLAIAKYERGARSAPYPMRLQSVVDIPNLEKNGDVYAIVVDKVVSVTPLSWNLSVKAKF